MANPLQPTMQPQMYADMREIADTLSRFGIQCPNVSPHDKGYVVTWFNFLTTLAPLARHKDLYKARIFGSQTGIR